MIPKIIHYCWFGRNPLPELAIKCIESWKKFLPNYEIKEWNEDNFDVNMIIYTAEAYRLKKYAFVSDYARFWILYNYGGLYFDTDVEIIKTIDDIVSRGAFMGFEKPGPEVPIGTPPNIAAGLGIGVEKGNFLFGEMCKWYENSHYISLRGTYTGSVVRRFTQLIQGLEKSQDEKGVVKMGDIYVYPIDYFCPMDYHTGEINLTENTRSIHRYHASWCNKGEKLTSKILQRIQNLKVRFVLSFIYSIK